MTKGILLVNLGTPDSPSVGDVRKYLAQFLMDPRVIDMAPIARLLLVRGIIVPFRAPRSAKLYQHVWDPERGSPLLYWSRLQQKQLSEDLGPGYVVELAMRYQNPSLENALQSLRQKGVDSIRVIPMFPQYASATSGSVIARVMEIISRWPVIIPVSFAGAFYDHPLLARAFAAKAAHINHADHDHVLFSFHGLPLRQLQRTEAGGHYCGKAPGCCQTIDYRNKHCYAAQCHRTAALIAAELAIPESKYTVCFQSRLGKAEWLRPYATAVIRDLAAAGTKRLLVFSPSFVTDCLETTVEIGKEYQELFRREGGEELQLVEGLNGSPQLAELLTALALEQPEYSMA
ncbi:ferrochelatase [Mucilaginibacter inviolabilis]|uniref:ferrochelatase n=1 Tax=Mucilaginibacter inviolabilis TaxID=2714892 RepID=UPI001931B8FB|nr:ferrochelatase [Mucilaginibacter inviolabilis]